MKTVKTDNVLCLTELQTGWVPSLLTAKVHSITAPAMSSIYFKKVLKSRQLWNDYMDHTNCICYSFCWLLAIIDYLFWCQPRKSNTLPENLTDDLQSNEIPLSSDLPLLYPHRCLLTYSAGTSALINCFPYLFRERMYSHSVIKISITFQRTESLV